MRIGFHILLGLLTSALSVGQARGADPLPIFLDQGPNWTQAARADFYTLDQGARMIPLTWLQALKQPNGQPFLGDSLARYGYLPNPANGNGLPVGFTATGPTGAQTFGMTCSACHTRQITAEGKTYRVDGGPAIVDFQSLLADLDTAVGAVLTDNAAFQPFAAAVLGSAASDLDDVSALRQRVDAWYLRYHTLMTRALPKDDPWGPARLDAVGMIFNRLTGLDLGPPPSRLIPDNIRRADAPTRYPFLWNAPVQDKIQWPGFAENGNDVLALARNLGQVIGVFGVFEPKKELFFVNFLDNNSANFGNLGKIEDLLKQLGPPKWPWELNEDLADEGKKIFDRPTAGGGCVTCHGIAPGKVRSFSAHTWATPVQDVGTDTREYDVLAWTAKTGVLQGAFIPFATRPLQETDLAFNILTTSVIGTIAQHVLSGSGDMQVAAAQVAQQPGQLQAAAAMQAGPLALKRLPPSLRDLEDAFNVPVPLPPDLETESMRAPSASVPAAASAASPRGAYAARVMQGIWAAAPYLHNGSVPTLADLLKPASERPTKFEIGPAYDVENVGLAARQKQFGFTLTTTDCSDRNSGRSRCGHEFGTQLSAEEKKALLEYLKKL